MGNWSYNPTYRSYNPIYNWKGAHLVEKVSVIPKNPAKPIQEIHHFVGPTELTDPKQPEDI